jgi:alkaline phosphatase D
MIRQFPLSLLASLGFALPALAQHDVQRNAVQQIALSKFDAAAKTLEGNKKPNAGKAETLFVEILSLLKRGQIDEARARQKLALEAGLPLERFAAGPHELLSKLPELKGVKAINLVHGPMVGSVTESAASFWVRTRRSAKVSIIVGERRASATTNATSGFTTVIRVDGLKPNTDYDYRIEIDDAPAKAEATRFRTFPTKAKPQPFSVGFGGGAGFVPEWERMWDNITTFKPNAFLMLGDNVYIDQPEHSLTQHYCYARRQSRPEWRRLIASTAIYSIWDDHDFGVNDCVPGPEIEKPAWKRKVWELYQQNWVNPSYGGGEKQPGCWYDFMIGDVHFIMLDGRYYRDLKGGSMLGSVQKAWLKKTLTTSSGTFKVIASPVPFSPNIKPGSKDPWDGFADERAELFSWIAKDKIEGVFLIAADRHRTDLRTIPNPGSYTLYEFESSKLTNRHTHPVVKTKGLIWGYNKTCSFGFMKFDTTKSDPQVTFELIDLDGNILQSHVLQRSTLK